MKATALLETQHRKVEATFERLKGVGGGSRGAELLVELANDLAAHMAIEQDIFYPAVRDADPELVDDSFEEHAMAELALKRLLKTRPEDATFVAKLAILEDLVLHHAEQEEEDLFPAVEAAMGEDALEELGAQMERAFASAKAEGFAALVPQGFAQTSADVARKEIMRPNGSAPISARAPR